jgi:two-component system, chemotaxis family, CheB/CheR fusion protein
MSEEINPQLEALLEYIRQNRGFDFRAYKHSSLGRRIDKRMQVLNVPDYTAYLTYLQAHPGEFTLLFNAILINVTEFFRDAPSWDHLRTEVIPKILEQKAPHNPIRVWSAGCSSGEEAYSVTMCLGEALGKQGLLDRVKVYATDVDEEALATARLGRFSEKAVETVPRPLLDKYFVRDDGYYEFDRDIQHVVIFGRHDLLQDPPISRVDLLLCRNTLMYFNNESQRRVLTRLHFAVNDSGFLFLGRAEMFLTHPSLFAPVDLKRRIFAKVRQPAYADRIPALTGRPPRRTDNDGDDDGEANLIADRAFEMGPEAHFALDAKGNLVRANERARVLLHLGSRDRDRARHYRDLDLPLEVIRAIEHMYTETLASRLKDPQHLDVQWPSPSGDPGFFQAMLRPIRGSAGLDGLSVVLQDATNQQHLQEQLHRSRQELETVSEELQSSNEELETTNEELQSTVEELETTNEELQSTNEELETMNEELQSTNEELHTMNDELRQRGDDLNSANGFLGSVLAGISHGLVVLNRAGDVTAWNPAAEEMWGLRAAEVEQKSFFSLDIGLPVEQLTPAVRAGLAGEPRTLTLQAVNRRGKSISCTIQITPLKSARSEIEGAVLMMQTAPASN